MVRSRLLTLKHISYALAALVVVVCALEAGLRIYDSFSGGRLTRTAADTGLMTRSWLLHHSLKPLHTEILPHADGGDAVTVATNSYGLRGPEPTVPKPPGVYRILCLGDDATYGAEVAETQTFSARLRELLQPHTRLKVEVVNAGVPGYCPLLSYLQLKLSLLSLQPDLVVLNFDMTDIADDHRYRRFAQVDEAGLPIACPHPELIAQRDPKRTALIDRFLVTRWIKCEVASLTADAAASEDQRDIDTPQGQYAWLKDNPPDWSVYIRQGLAPIELIHQTTEQIFARLLVIAAPTPWQVSGTATVGKLARSGAGVPQRTLYRSRAPFEILSTWLRGRGIAYCDLSPGFHRADRPERLFLRNVPRLSADGHDLYARELAAHVLRVVPGVWDTTPGYETQPPDPTRQAMALPR